MMTPRFRLGILTGSILGSVAALGLITAAAAQDSERMVPGDLFDLSNWKITLPLDDNGDDRADEVSVSRIQNYEHTDFFYLNEDGGLVFASPNKAVTTANTTNTRSELRQMIRGTNTRIGTHDPGNNFAVEARNDSHLFGSIGGKLEATLRVDHVSLNAGDPSARAAYSVVVGQIHATKYDSTRSGFGYGNEPIKIYFKKYPDHEYGSVFWNYERNLARDDPNRDDLNVPVFGNGWDNPEDPGEAGIALGEEFSYEINVFRNVMYLTFHTERHGTVVQSRSLVRGADSLDNPYAYGGDTLYFKAGVYNQCSTRSGGGNWYAACGGTGEWSVDKANGDYVQATFSRIELSEGTPPE